MQDMIQIYLICFFSTFFFLLRYFQEILPSNIIILILYETFLRIKKNDLKKQKKTRRMCELIFDPNNKSEFLKSEKEKKQIVQFLSISSKSF